jgi:CRISPR-associated protein Cmx8
MAKKINKKKQNIEKGLDSITLEYDLYSLPTAQHKAGLAGLLILIDTMKKRKMENVPEVTEISETGCKIIFNKKNIQAIFDDFFEAAWEETERNSRLKEKDKTLIRPKRIEKKVIIENGKEKEKEIFIYDVVVPAGNFFKALYPKNADGWIKIWRDMLWNTLRGIHTTKNVYKERAENKKSSEAVIVWRQMEKDILKPNEIKRGITSSLYVGAQDVNAENVPFIGNVKDNFLLYFWTIVSLIFQPRTFSIDGKYENEGYAIAIPEPANLKNFVDDAENMLGSIAVDMEGYRPKASIVDLPAEGGFEYLLNIVKNMVKRKELSINAVEIKHLEKRGNNIKVLQALKITPNKNIISNYENIKKECANYFNKTIRIKNLIGGNVWFDGFDEAFSEWPMSFFVSMQGKSPYNTMSFEYEILQRFNKIEKLKEGGNIMEKDDELSLKVYRLIREYVNQRVAKKNGFPDTKDIYSFKYHDDREHVCTDAFLAMRGRREKDFVEYFTGSICSVPQFLPEEDYLLVSKTLMEDWEKVKTLSMLAISACSYTSKPKENGGGK